MSTPTKRGHCDWMIGSEEWIAPKCCPAKPAFYCPESGSQLCNTHADDYEDLFGEGCLREFPVEGHFVDVSKKV